MHPGVVPCQFSVRSSGGQCRLVMPLPYDLDPPYMSAVLPFLISLAFFVLNCNVLGHSSGIVLFPFASWGYPSHYKDGINVWNWILNFRLFVWFAEHFNVNAWKNHCSLNCHSPFRTHHSSVLFFAVFLLVSMRITQCSGLKYHPSLDLDLNLPALVCAAV